MGDQQFNDCLASYIEKDVAASIDNKVIIQQFQNIKTCERKFKNFKYLSFFFFFFGGDVNAQYMGN